MNKSNNKGPKKEITEYLDKIFGGVNEKKIEEIKKNIEKNKNESFNETKNID